MNWKLGRHIFTGMVIYRFEWDIPGDAYSETEDADATVLMCRVLDKLELYE